jgi:hypothetical protein
MTKDEALKLALKALEIGLTLIEDFGSTEQLNAQHKAITAIYEALAQPEHGWTPERIAGMARLKEAQDKKLAEPEQEPVGEIVDAIEGAFKCSFTKMLPVGTKLYTTPPQRTWVGLTDKEIDELWMSHHDDFGNALSAIDYERAIEAKLKERNG